MAAAAMLAGVGSASATLTVISGDIYALDPTAKDYGAVRFKDFINAGDGGRGQNLYLQNNSSSLGSATGCDGRARVNGDPLWTVGGAANYFKFEYRPVAGVTDKILAGATDRMYDSATPPDLRFSRVIDDPLSTVNFISFYVQSNEGSPQTTDNITVNLTDPDGNALLPGSLSYGYPPGGVAKWYLTNPSLLANGFILSGNIVLSGTLERTESDKVQIAFGHTAVPVPSTYLAAALLGLPILVQGIRGLRLKPTA